MQEACSEWPGEGLPSRKSENASFIFLLAEFFSSVGMDTKRTIPVFKCMKIVSHRAHREHREIIMHSVCSVCSVAIHARCAGIRRSHHATSDCRDRRNRHWRLNLQLCPQISSDTNGTRTDRN